MANRTSGPRGRSRKPRPGGARQQDVAPPAPRSGPAGEEPRGGARGARRTTPSAGQSAYGERPHAPWHPLPLSEILILAGAIAFAVALTRREASSGGPLLLAGIAAVGLGTIEVTWREHNAGYRSHTMLLALLPVIVLHTAVVLGVSLLTTPPALLTVGMLVVDVALYVFLFRVLRARFATARARRVARV